MKFNTFQTKEEFFNDIVSWGYFTIKAYLGKIAADKVAEWEKSQWQDTEEEEEKVAAVEELGASEITMFPEEE